MVKRLSAVLVLVVALGLVSLTVGAIADTTPLLWAEDAVLAEQTGRININTASADELSTLEGIGGKTAQAIIDYRKANGPFAATEDIMNVKGVGERKYEAIKDLIMVGKAQ